MLFRSQSRGSRLKGPDDELFTGEYWAGETAVGLGLADGIGDLRATLRARYGEKVLTPVIAPAVSAPIAAPVTTSLG